MFIVLRVDAPVGLSSYRHSLMIVEEFIEAFKSGKGKTVWQSGRKQKQKNKINSNKIFELNSWQL